MKVFCMICQKTVGQVPDDKIPIDRSVTAKCPHCGEKIELQRLELDAEVTNPQIHSIPPTKKIPTTAECKKTDS